MNTTTESKIGLLTRREKEVLALVALGMTNQCIAETLVISKATVINHLHSIFRKLGFSSRTEAAIYALHHNIGDKEVEK